MREIEAEFFGIDQRPFLLNIAAAEHFAESPVGQVGRRVVFLGKGCGCGERVARMAVVGVSMCRA